MGNRMAFLLAIALVVGLAAGAARADLLAYYPFEEGSGTTTADAAGNGNDGTLNGNVEWVPGVDDSAVRFDTAGERVVITALDPTAKNDAMTLAAWVFWEGQDHSITHQGIIGKRQGWDPRTFVKWFWEATPTGQLAFRNGDAAVNAPGVLVPYENEWAHVAMTWDSGAVVQYINAVQVGTGNITFRDTADATVVSIGSVSATNNETFVGSIDEARIYDTALTLDELVRAMKRTPPDLAYGPEPRDGTMIEETWMSLKWKAGAYAVTHDVYLGTSFDEVSEGAEGTFLGNTSQTSMIVGIGNNPLSEGLVPGTTYYWRVDEVNDGDPASPWQGDVWSFWLPPRTAYAPTPADGTLYALANSQLSWSAGLKTFMRTVYFGADADEVASASGALPQLETTFNPGALESAKTYYWRVDEFDGTWRPGSVWSFTVVPQIPVDDPSLVLWWTLDEGEGLTAVDWSGHGNHGMVHGQTQWEVGYQGTALTFDDDVYVEAAGYPGVTGANPRTLCAWIKTTETDINIMSWGQNVAGEKWRMRLDATGGLRIEVNGGYLYGVTNLADGQWHHVAVTFRDDGSPDAVDALLYVDGSLDATAASQETPVNTATTGAVRIGESPWHNAPFVGVIDDARIYNKVLTEEDIRQVMRGSPLLAWDFEPANGRTFDIRDVSALSWQAGDLAAEHDVYLGTEADAVLNAEASDTSGIYRGRQTGTTYSPAGGFGWGQTHYWRIDEVNTDGTIAKGGVRTFTIADFLPVEDFESYTDEEGSRVYEAWIDGWTNGTGSVVGNLVAPFAEQTIVHGGRQSMPLDYNNVNSPFYSEAEYVFAAQQDWTTHGVDTLSLWVQGSPGRFSEDAGVFTVGASGHDIWDNADDFRFVYKRLNGNGSITARVESVANTNAWAKAGVMIRETLTAGSRHGATVITPGNGVSFPYRSFPDDISVQTNTTGLTAPRWVRITRTGDMFKAEHSADGQTWTMQDTEQSVTMTGNVYIGLCLTSHDSAATTTGVFSNVATTGGVTGQWQEVWLGDDPDLTNGVDDLYVAVEDSTGKVATSSNPTAVTATAWTQWPIPLSDFAGVNLARVKKMYIGIGNRANPTPNGAGRLYIDDITLTKPVAGDAGTP